MVLMRFVHLFCISLMQLSGRRTLSHMSDSAECYDHAGSSGHHRQIALVPKDVEALNSAGLFQCRKSSILVCFWRLIKQSHAFALINLSVRCAAVALFHGLAHVYQRWLRGRGSILHQLHVAMASHTPQSQTHCERR